VLRLRGQQKVLDPTLQLSLFIGCGANLQREYLVLLDLPARAETVSEPVATVAAPQTTQPTVRNETAPPAETKLRPARQPVPAKPRAVMPPAASIATAGVPSKNAVEIPVAETNIPQPAEAPAAAVPMEAPPPAASAPAPVAPPTPQAAGAESDPLITAGLILLISLLLVGIWYQHRRNIQAAALEDHRLDESPGTRNTLLTLREPVKAASPSASPVIAKPLTAPSSKAEEDEMPLMPASASSEYMMDLTDVMLSLGETQRALKALHEFVQEHPDDAVAPWLRLLDLLRTRGKKTEFQALASKLHQVFNIATPQWEVSEQEPPPSADGETATSLEDFPHIRQCLVDTWGTAEGLKYLDILMRDNRAGQRQGFPTQIAEEAILLHDILTLRLNHT
jgi:hypothetical protein